VLRERPWDHDYVHIGWFRLQPNPAPDTILHTAGNWITGVSGVLLFSNIASDCIKAARTVNGLRALSPSGGAGSREPPIPLAPGSRLLLALPLSCWCAPAIVRAFDDPLSLSAPSTRRARLRRQLGEAQTPRQSPTLAEAISSALALYPGSTLAAVEFTGFRLTLVAIRVTQSHDVAVLWHDQRVHQQPQWGVLENYAANAMPTAYGYGTRSTQCTRERLAGLPAAAWSPWSAFAAHVDWARLGFILSAACRQAPLKGMHPTPKLPLFVCIALVAY